MNETEELKKENEKLKADLERVKKMLKVYATCNACIHHVDYNLCEKGGYCKGEYWEC